MDDVINKINNVFEEENKVLLDTITFMVYEIENSDKNDLFMLTKLLDDKSLTNLIDYFNGNTIRVPTKEQFKISSILAYMFYLTDIKQMSFQEAKDSLKDIGIDISGQEVLVGKRLSSIRRKLTIKLMEIVKEMEDNG